MGLKRTALKRSTKPFWTETPARGPNPTVKEYKTLLKKLTRKTPIKKSAKPIRTVNPTAKAKRVARQKRHYASVEYKAARKEAMERAGNRCEYAVIFLRCGEMERLEAHHVHYPKSRPLEASDLVILCRRHHHLLEVRDHPTRHQHHK